MSDPVLVVGAGPTGLVAALELSRLGVAVRLIDKAQAPATTSRAIGIQPRTLELMQQRGLADEMVRLGNKASGGGIYGNGGRLTRLDFSQAESRFDFILMLSQAETERILRERLERLGVAIERGVELVALSQDAQSQEAAPVHAVLRHTDGRLEDASAPWLISAEGAHSLVRTTLDLPFDGKTLADPYALADLFIAGDLAETDIQIFSSPHGFLAVFPLGGERSRVIASTPHGAEGSGETLALEALQDIYDARAPIPARLHDLGWSSWFHINSRMVTHLKRGRLLLGGDSAHIHSPAEAQGMNTGIQDMINLGWKLAMVMQGQAREQLLDTYEQDRLPVIRNVLSRTEAITDVMGSENPLVRSLVNHLGPWVAGADLVQHNAVAQMTQLALGYRESALSMNHPHGGALQAGDRIPGFEVRCAGSETRLQDLLNPSRFTLMVTQGVSASAIDPELLQSAALYSKLAEIVVLSPASDTTAARLFEAAFGRHVSVFLVRPDGYVGLAAGQSGATRHLASYCSSWTSPN